MARLLFQNYDDDGSGISLVRKSFGQTAMLLFLLATVLIVVLQRGRGRGRGRGCSSGHGRLMTENDQFTDIETGQSNDRDIVNQHDDLHEETNTDHEEDMNESRATRKPRSHSNGDYGKPPQPDKIRAIPVGGGHIMDLVATRTITSIIRQHWPVGCYTYHQAILQTQGEFERTVLQEFKAYYKYEDGVSEEQGNKEVITHVKNRMRGLKSEEKARALKQAVKNGKSIFDQKPTYFSNDVWNSLCNHFLQKEHTDKSEKNKKNRSKKILTHTSGATSHTKIMQDLTRKRQRCPSRLELFESTYMPKGSQSYTSEAAKTIAERYKSILDERLHTLGEQDEEPLAWWIEAAGPVKKNCILGEPRIPASDLLSGAYYNKHTTNSSSQSTCGRCLSDDLFFKVVRETLQAASSSSEFNETVVSSEQVENLAEDVLGGNTSNSEDAIDKEKREEVIRLVMTTLQSIYSRVHSSLKEKQLRDQANASSSLNEVEDVKE